MIRGDKGWNAEARTRSMESEKKPFQSVPRRLDFLMMLETGAKIISLYNVYSPHDLLVYPPKIYLPTLIIVTVGPLPSHRE